MLATLRTQSCFYLLVAAMMTHAPAVLTAQQFRIETEVFQEGIEQPVSTNLTLFDGGLIFDFLSPNAQGDIADEIAIFDTRQRQFVLLDTERKVKTTVPEHQIVRLMAALSTDGVIKDEFLADPKFEEDFDLETQKLTLSSNRMTYTAVGSRPDDGSYVPAYHEFADNFARLNVTDPRRMPPFARLKFNAALKKYGLIPDEITITLKPSADSQDAIRLRTTHSTHWRLSSQDQQLIETAKEFWIRYKPLELREYRRLPESIGSPTQPPTNPSGENNDTEPEEATGESQLKPLVPRKNNG